MTERLDHGPYWIFCLENANIPERRIPREDTLDPLTQVVLPNSKFLSSGIHNALLGLFHSFLIYIKFLNNVEIVLVLTVN